MSIREVDKQRQIRTIKARIMKTRDPQKRAKLDALLAPLVGSWDLPEDQPTSEPPPLFASVKETHSDSQE